MANNSNHRQIPGIASEYRPETASCPPNPANSPTSPTDHFKFVPIFFEKDYQSAYETADLSRFTAAYNPSAKEEPSAQPFPFQFPFPQIEHITMAERFPKIEDLELGESVVQHISVS